MMISRLRAIRFLVFLMIIGGSCGSPPAPEAPVFEPGIFVGERAYQDVVQQVAIGPRYPGSPGHAEVREWLVVSLGEAGWQAVVLESDFNGTTVYNIEACRATDEAGDQGYMLLGAHYDTRIYADQDPDMTRRDQPVPGANDGASGVAVLLELARVLPGNLSTAVCLVFFDAEDNGRIAEWEWATGSRLYVEQLEDHPYAVVIVDMVGDADQQLSIEQNSDPVLAAEIWMVARELGIETFLWEPGPRLVDDHTAFLQRGIPAVNIIDFSYPYWHTVEDTPDKVSPQSLQNVGDVLLTWLLGN
jgi:Iap family predicted aminopeptidase